MTETQGSDPGTSCMHKSREINGICDQSTAELYWIPINRSMKYLNVKVFFFLHIVVVLHMRILAVSLCYVSHCNTRIDVTCRVQRDEDMTPVQYSVCSCQPTSEMFLANQSSTW